MTASKPESQDFNPGKYLIDFKGRAYLDVAHRLLWLNDQHERFVIQTTLLHYGEDYAVFEACVTITDEAGGAIRTATGHGAARRKDMPSHIASRFVEKAETAAVGRALGMLGLGTLSAQEFDDTEHLSDTPTPIKRRPDAPLQRAPASPAVASPGPAGVPTSGPAPVAPAEPPARSSPHYRELTEDEWTVFYDKVQELAGYSVADVAMLLGGPPAEHLRAMHAAGQAKTGKSLVADLIAHKREGRPIPGVPRQAVAF